jgi:hypothetical protein
MHATAKECVVGNVQGDRKEDHDRVTGKCLGERSGNSKRKNKIIHEENESRGKEEQTKPKEEIKGLRKIR